LDGSNERNYELNELSWWSNWTQVEWLDENAYVMGSTEFEEYFFNRGGFIKVRADAERSLERMEVEFERRGRVPHVFVQSNRTHRALLGAFAEKGYRIADQMSVMEMGAIPSFEGVNPDLVLELVGGGGGKGSDGDDDEGRLKEWAATYLRAFYGETRLLGNVNAVVERISKKKTKKGEEVSFLLASSKKKPVGVLALSRSAKVCGAYCVGTDPEYRGKHIATTMLEFSHRLAEGEGRRLILQTILSDSVEALYLKLGFDRVYMKDLFVKDPRRTLKS
jgi:N-acetylglutamate synthase-like GNAT family acetyltransferase